MLASVLAHVGALAMAAAVLPPLNEHDVVEDDAAEGSYTLFPMGIVGGAAEHHLGVGSETRCKCDALSMGDADAEDVFGRYGVAGPPANPDPHIARRPGDYGEWVEVPAGLSKSRLGGDVDAPTAPWGRDDSYGTDPISARGAMWGDSIQHNAGDGGMGLRHDATDEEESSYGYRCRLP